MTEDIVPVSSIRNTASETEVELQGLLMLANAMSGGKAEDVILAQEAAGQRQLVNSDRLPTRSQSPDAEYAAMGITFGEPDPSDPLFRPANLPQGWKRVPTDHSMWSKVIDELGRERVSVFYKAAFYDRDAFMSAVSPAGYLRDAVWHEATPVLDDVWLTRAVAVETLTDLENGELTQAVEADEWAAKQPSNKDFWTKNARKHRDEATKYAIVRERIEAAA